MMDLRLFPLQTVLFPGMRMPLHIFEERYKLMIRECLEESAPFGVVLIRSGEEVAGEAQPYAIGTTARVTDVEQLDEGRLNIFTTGLSRFRIMAVTTTSPYLRGEVEIIEPKAEPMTPELHARAEAMFVAYLRLYLALGSQWTRGVELPYDANDAADYIAARMELPSQTKQELLEEASAVARIERELQLIAESLPLMQARVEAQLRQRTTGFGVLN